MFYKKKIYFYIIGSLSLILGYIIKENSAGGGLHDFNVLSPHILNFSKDNHIAIKLFFPPSTNLEPITKLLISAFSIIFGK